MIEHIWLIPFFCMVGVLIVVISAIKGPKRTKAEWFGENDGRTPYVTAENLKTKHRGKRT